MGGVQLGTKQKKTKNKKKNNNSPALRKLIIVGETDRVRLHFIQRMLRPEKSSPSPVRGTGSIEQFYAVWPLLRV